MSGINHPLVLESAHTCSACPDQYEGTLTDGTAFYLRYRSGHAELGVGADLDAAVMDTIDGARTCEQIGDYLDGMFDSDAQRDAVFGRLLARRLETMVDELIEHLARQP